ncbi:tripeptidyl peptidase [Moniliophthora roreri]|nr:tripeptidyl peptidase [Moniliophthora roreri]
MNGGSHVLEARKHGRGLDDIDMGVQILGETVAGGSDEVVSAFAVFPYISSSATDTGTLK